MPRHKKGTVVRAFTKEELGAEKWSVNGADEFIEPHGYIWIVQRFIPLGHGDNEHHHDAYECRSIADGHVEQLFPQEITTRPKKED